MKKHNVSDVLLPDIVSFNTALSNPNIACGTSAYVVKALETGIVRQVRTDVEDKLFPKNERN